MGSANLICVPGQRLCLSNDTHISGCGTYERQGYIYSTLAGEVHVVEKDKSTIIEVHSSNDQSIVPTPGDIVTAMVMMVNPRFSKCTIKCIGDVVLTRPYRAILRREDVRAFEKDSIEMYQSFRPGDIILARVLPTTDIHSYQLSTAENELGVVIAHSEAEWEPQSHRVPMIFCCDSHFITVIIARSRRTLLVKWGPNGFQKTYHLWYCRVAMVPVSWTEMQCPKTYNKEPRKVAKVVPETLPVDGAPKES